MSRPRPPLVGGILAAGEGSRLQQEGRPVLKPLLEIAGKSLIRRTLEGLLETGVEPIHVIINEQSIEVRDRVEQLALPVPIHFVVRSTASSMHSLLALRPAFDGRAALISMVDSVLPPGCLSELVAQARRRRNSIATLALTSFVDDEKPLSVRLRGDRITDIGTSLPRTHWVTAGIYYFEPRAWPILDHAAALGMEKMRNFLGHLLHQGIPVHGHRLPKTVDVDRPRDVRTAEEAIALWEQTK